MLLARELRDGGPLQFPKRGLAVLGEDALDRLPRALNDALVGIHETPPEQACSAAPHGALASA